METAEARARDIGSSADEHAQATRRQAAEAASRALERIEAIEGRLNELVVGLRADLESLNAERPQGAIEAGTAPSGWPAEAVAPAPPEDGPADQVEEAPPAIGEEEAGVDEGPSPAPGAVEEPEDLPAAYGEPTEEAAEEPLRDVEAVEQPPEDAEVAEEPFAEVPLADEEPPGEAVTSDEPVSEVETLEEPPVEPETLEEPPTETEASDEPLIDAESADEPPTAAPSEEATLAGERPDEAGTGSPPEAIITPLEPAEPPPGTDEEEWVPADAEPVGFDEDTGDLTPSQAAPDEDLTEEERAALAEAVLGEQKRQEDWLEADQSLPVEQPGGFFGGQPVGEPGAEEAPEDPEAVDTERRGVFGRIFRRRG